VQNETVKLYDARTTFNTAVSSSSQQGSDYNLSHS